MVQCTALHCTALRLRHSPVIPNPTLPAVLAKMVRVRHLGVVAEGEGTGAFVADETVERHVHARQ